MIAEAGKVSFGGGFVELDADTKEPDDSSSGDEAGGVEASRRDLFRFEGQDFLGPCFALGQEL